MRDKLFDLFVAFLERPTRVTFGWEHGHSRSEPLFFSHLSSVQARDSPIPPPAFSFARDYAAVVSRSRLRLSGADATASDVSNGFRQETKPANIAASPVSNPFPARIPRPNVTARKGGAPRVPCSSPVTPLLFVGLPCACTRRGWFAVGSLGQVPWQDFLLV